MQMKLSDGQSEFSLVFNFAIICYLWNSRKLNVHEKLVFYSNALFYSKQSLVSQWC